LQIAVKESSISKPRIPMRPATRSALIIGGLLLLFIINAMLWVGKKAIEIRRERDAALAMSNPATGEMILIPAGKFTMGSNDGQSDEKPLHDVKVDRFWMDKTEVTNEQFARFVGETKYVTVAERKPDPKEFPAR
jgi:sulfatase modifying factor 1